jgi:hypothetical protein
MMARVAAGSALKTARVSENQVQRFEPGARSGLALRNVFADNAFVALQLPAPVWTILKPLDDARLCMNLAVHHGDAGLIAVGDHPFQADLSVAQQCDKGNEHGISISMNDSAHFTMQRLCQTAGGSQIRSV